MTEASRATGKWADPGVPHKGWACVGIEDLDEPSAICEMCETQEIRYVHYMTHPKYSGQFGVGCVCAGKMEEDYEGAQKRESSLRNASGRKRRWLTRKWRVSSKGNAYINVDGYNIVIFPSKHEGSETWAFRVANRQTDDSLQSRRPYTTEDAAKLRSFDAMIWMQERGR